MKDPNPDVLFISRNPLAPGPRNRRFRGMLRRGDRLDPLAQNSLQIFIRSGDRLDLEILDEHVENSGTEEGRK
jgi:hypothetical protein